MASAHDRVLARHEAPRRRRRRRGKSRTAQPPAAKVVALLECTATTATTSFSHSALVFLARRQEPASASVAFAVRLVAAAVLGRNGGSRAPRVSSLQGEKERSNSAVDVTPFPSVPKPYCSPTFFLLNPAPL